MLAARTRAETQQPASDPHQGWGKHYGLLRQSHIFASVARDVLETKYLAEVAPTPLSLSQFHLLKLISLNGRHHVGEVAEFLGVSGPAVTKNIDKLERLGLVERAPSPGDRRATLLRSSPRGRELVERYEHLKQRRLAPILARFTQAELDLLAGLLQRFTLAIIEQEDQGGEICLRCAAYFDSHCPVEHVRGDCAYQRVHSSRGPTREAG